jgi:ABC-type uncharacterized transport system involved in gliding motility auxiliary subunit
VNWRELTKKRTVAYGAGSAATVLLVLGILVLVNLLAGRYPCRWDATQGETQSLSPVTRALLAQVTQPLTMTAFIPEGMGDRQNAREVLSRYTYLNPRVSYHLVDPEKEPLKAQQAGYRFSGNVLVEYEGRRQMADRPEENDLSNALRRVLKPGTKVVYFLTGHGERSLEDTGRGGLQVAQKALGNEGYEVKALNLLTQAGVPKDAAAVVVAAPKKPLLAQEVGALKDYLSGGGRLLVLLEAFEDGGLKDFLAAYGVELDNGMILDHNQLTQALGVSPVVPLVAQYGPSPITRDFKNLVTAFPLSRPLTVKTDVKGVMPQILATTMPSSWEKRGKEWLKTGRGDFDPQRDQKGPFTLAAQLEIKGAPATAGEGRSEGQKPEETTAYMVVFGDADFAANAYFNLFGNGDLFLNAVNFLAGEEKQIVIREARKAQPLHLTRPQIWGLLVVSLGVGPLVMLVSGVWVFVRRRKARR